MQPAALSHNPGSLMRFEGFPSLFVPPRPVDVWLPSGFDARIRYPVLYMHDGQNLFRPEDAFGGEPWAVDRAIMRLVDAGTIPPVIVVGVWNAGDNRWGEYLPEKPGRTPELQTFAPSFAEKFPVQISSNLYLQFLVGELKPFIDRTYATRPDRANTFVMGSSMGGLISLYAVTEYPQVFGGAGCLSTHWLIGENLLVDYFADSLPQPGRHRLYFDYGTETLDAGYGPFQKRMDAHMQAAGYRSGVDWVTRKFEGAEHSELSWRNRVHVPLAFLFGSPAPTPTTGKS